MPEEKNNALNIENEEEKAGEDEEILDDKDYQSEVRKSVSEYVAERRAKRAEKKLQEGEEGEKGEEDKKPDIASLVQEEVKKALSPIADFTRSQATDSEINVFLAVNPQFKKYEKLARKDAVAYPTTPVAKIFRALAYEDASKTSETQKAEAEAKAKGKKLSGEAKRENMKPAELPANMTQSQINDVYRAARTAERRGEKLKMLDIIS